MKHSDRLISSRVVTRTDRHLKIFTAHPSTAVSWDCVFILSFIAANYTRLKMEFHHFVAQKFDQTTAEVAPKTGSAFHVSQTLRVIWSLTRLTDARHLRGGQRLLQLRWEHFHQLVIYRNLPTETDLSLNNSPTLKHQQDSICLWGNVKENWMQIRRRSLCLNTQYWRYFINKRQN